MARKKATSSISKRCLHAKTFFQRVSFLFFSPFSSPSFWPAYPEAFRYATKGFSLWQITTAEGKREKDREEKKEKAVEEATALCNKELRKGGKWEKKNEERQSKDPYGVASILKPQIPGNDLRKDRSLVLFLSFLQLTRN